ncbi:MAG: hypothetical protein JWN12_339 [Candidatus Saccharibacteria bacterium]|nr:hypothetical protein [Candidatus Saccharibacteria bacterium]
MIIMSLLDDFEVRKFGPYRDDKWEDVSDFTSPDIPQTLGSFDDRRAVAVDEARAHAEKAYLDIQRQSDENLL